MYQVVCTLRNQRFLLINKVQSSALQLSALWPVQMTSWEDMASRPRSTRFRRSNSFSSWESLQSVSTAGDVIRQAGYPLEEHTVTTSDGYVLQMERMPRRGLLPYHCNLACPYHTHLRCCAGHLMHVIVTFLMVKSHQYAH